MLTITEISERIAELLRGALPYAIVNNDPNKSIFTKLVSFGEVQEALDAGHTWIKVTSSDIVYNKFTVSGNKIRIEGDQGVVIDGKTGGDAIIITGNYNNLSHLRVQTTAGQGNSYNGVSVEGGQYNIVSYVTCVESDANGLSVESGTWNTFLGCHVINCDGYGLYSNGQGTHFHSCMVQNGDTGGAQVATNTDNQSLVGVTLLNSGDLDIASGSDEGLYVGNLTDGAIQDSGSGNALAGNNQF
jgi:hypothetical protein